MNTKPLLFICLFTVSLFITLSCSKSNNQDVDLPSLHQLYFGDSLILNPNHKDFPEGSLVIWQSSDTSIVYVSTTGIVKGRMAGTATITATLESLIISYLVTILPATITNPKVTRETCIAHAGGAIEQHNYTNSLEALNLSYAKGCKLFELDIMETADGHFVGGHHWSHFKEIAGLPINDEALMLAEFTQQKMYGKYTPMNMEMINAWFEKYTDAILVTDKVNTPTRFAESFKFKERLIMELFSWSAVEEAIAIGITPMPSENLVFTTDNIEEKLLTMNIKYIAISRRLIEANKNLLLRLKQQGVKVYVYHVNFDAGKDEQYVLEHEIEWIHGMYADNLKIYTK
ncbi:MAG: Ig-like domain-containing protein [Cellulosilyticaceae bacterium]